MKRIASMLLMCLGLVTNYALNAWVAPPNALFATGGSAWLVPCLRLLVVAEVFALAYLLLVWLSNDAWTAIAFAAVGIATGLAYPAVWPLVVPMPDPILQLEGSSGLAVWYASGVAVLGLLALVRRGSRGRV